LATVATVGIEVEEGFIPHFIGVHGLTVTYCVFKDIKQEDTHTIGDVSMMTCIDGRVMEANDIAEGILVIPTQELDMAGKS